MKIEHFGGKVECNDLNDVNSILRMRYGNGVNEFWLYGEKRYPCLGIMVNNHYAYMHYFPENKHPGFQSIGIDTGLELGKMSAFYTNTVDEEIEVINDAVVPFSIALTAAKEFFETLEIPKCIEWFEL